MAKLLKVDKEVCIGCGLCVTLAPKTFRLDKDSKAEVINSAGDDDKTIQEAIDACPVTAIKWVDS